MSPGIRIMLVDDHAIVRSGFRRLLELQPNVSVIAEAAGSDEAYSLYVVHRPDVVVMDLSMPGIGGLDAIRRIVGREPTARILVFSMHEDGSIAEQAIQVGARGYVTKSNPPEVLAAAVADVAAGKLALSQDVAKAIAILKLTGDKNPLDRLSARELEIFRLIASGLPAGDIARSLSLSGKTVANYHTLIKQKLGLSSDVELVLLAQRRHIV